MEYPKGSRADFLAKLEETGDAGQSIAKHIRDWIPTAYNDVEVHIVMGGRADQGIKKVVWSCAISFRDNGKISFDEYVTFLFHLHRIAEEFGILSE